MKGRTEAFIGSLIFLLCLATLFGLKGSPAFYYLLPIGVSWVGILLIIKGIDKIIFGKKLFERNRKDQLHIVIGSIGFCIILDFFGVYVSRLWYYPVLDLGIYLALAPLGFFVYTKILFLLYESFERKFEPIQSIEELNLTPHYGTIMKIELIAGILGVIVTAFYSISLINSMSIAITQISQSSNFIVDWWFIIVVLLTTTFLFEFLSYENNKETLTLNLINGNIYPIIAVLFSTVIAVAIIELVNVPFGVWEFSNWPMEEVKILGLPIFVWIAWPFQFPAFLAIFRNLFPKEEKLW